VSLFFYLGLCVIFSSLVTAMAGGGGGLDRALPAIAIVIEVLLMLLVKGLLDVPGLSDTDARNVGCILVACVTFSEFFRRNEKGFPLLAFFAGLTQLLFVFDVVNA
jgi:hypothetical protein